VESLFKPEKHTETKLTRKPFQFKQWPSSIKINNKWYDAKELTSKRFMVTQTIGFCSQLEIKNEEMVLLHCITLSRIKALMVSFPKQCTKIFT